MIKVFRRIRKMMVTQNKLGNYLIYALGEIILVVIGILIALQLNNLNEAKKANSKIDKIVVLLEEEINFNIKECNFLLEYYHRKDSVIQLVKNERLLEEDYRQNRSLLTLINYYSSFVIQDYYAKSLIASANQIPEKYHPILNDITMLNSYDTKKLRQYFDVMASFNERMHERWAENYEWFSEPNDLSHVDERIDFFVNDPAYINDVRLYSMYSKDNVVMFLKGFRNRSQNILDKLEQVKEN